MDYSKFSQLAICRSISNLIQPEQYSIVTRPLWRDGWSTKGKHRVDATLLLHQAPFPKPNHLTTKGVWSLLSTVLSQQSNSCAIILLTSKQCWYDVELTLLTLEPRLLTQQKALDRHQTFSFDRGWMRRNG